MEQILTVENLKIHFHDAAADHFAVNDISFSMAQGEIIGLVGESGSGKSVTAMSISGLMPKRKAEKTGSIRVAGKEIFRCSDKDILSILGQDLGVVFQEPMTAMNPVMPIGKQVEEALLTHTKLSKQARKERALEAMQMAELNDPVKLYNLYPHQLSGGMLQRVMIACAIISHPKLLLADEPTTALDVTTQAEILNLLKRLNQENNMAILFISHDLHVVRKLCNRVLVMEKGKIVEQGPVEEIFHNPQHPYTQKLIAAIPSRSSRLI